MRQQKCSQFNSKGNYCKNLAEVLVGSDGREWPVDFCEMHNHMDKTGIPLKCWRCGDKENV